jgi:hypothetical protein
MKVPATVTAASDMNNDIGSIIPDATIGAAIYGAANRNWFSSINELYKQISSNIRRVYILYVNRIGFLSLLSAPPPLPQCGIPRVLRAAFSLRYAAPATFRAFASQKRRTHAAP